MDRMDLAGIIERLHFVAEHAVFADLIVLLPDGKGKVITAGQGDELAQLQEAVQAGGRPTAILSVADVADLKGISTIAVTRLPGSVPETEWEAWRDAIRDFILELCRLRGIEAGEIRAEWN